MEGSRGLKGDISASRMSLQGPIPFINYPVSDSRKLSGVRGPRNNVNEPFAKTHLYLASIPTEEVLKLVLLLCNW